MNITKHEVAKTTIKLDIELLSEEMKPYVEKAVAKISKEVKIDGFRPGKVPYDILKTKISEMEIYQEAANEAINDTLPRAVKQEAIDFVGQPEVQLEKIVPGEALAYSATFALMPNVDLKNYQKITVKKAAAKFDEDKYNRTLEDLRKMHSKTQAVHRAAQDQDQVHIDFDIKLAGVSIEGGQGTNVPLVIGEQRFIPGFEENLVGLQANEEKQFTVNFPEDYGAKHLAGKECEAYVTVKTVSEVVLPELNDDFAKQLNFESAEELTKKIRENIQQELNAEVDRKFETAVIEAVIDQAEFDPIPDSLLRSEQDQMYAELGKEVEQQGGKMEDYLKHIKKTEEELRDSWKDSATKRVQAALIMKAVGEQDDITVLEEEIEKTIEEYKEMYKQYPEQLGQFDSLDFRAYVRSMMRNQKVMEKLKEYAESSSK